MRWAYVQLQVIVLLHIIGHLFIQTITGLLQSSKIATVGYFPVSALPLKGPMALRGHVIVPGHRNKISFASVEQTVFNLQGNKLTPAQ